jgi:CO dehydrogenase/acetyl-CoA synthase beta subunit
MFSLFLDIMNGFMFLYFVGIIVMLVRINIQERMSRGRTLGQAVLDIFKDTFYITRIGK